MDSQEEFTGGERAYRLINQDGRVYQSVAMGAPEPRSDPKFHIPLIHPITKKECPVPSNGWSRAPETLQGLMDEEEILFGPDETTQPRRKVFLTNETKRQVSSVIQEAKRGKTDVDNLGLEFPYCHPVSLYETLLGAASPDVGDVVLDFFAGSGTNCHAVINLNRQDGANRKCILVEIADHFDTVLLPRIKKVTFTPEWKDGKPTRQATPEESARSPRIVKYLRLESYDDALNNIKYTSAQQELYDFNDYLLKYMLSWETKDSETLLNLEKISRPFDYKLNIVNGQESRQEDVDIPETFAYLLGLRTKTRRVYSDAGRRYLVYRGYIDHREIAIIWRDNAGWEKKDYEQDKKFVANQKFTEGSDEIFINGDSLIPGALTLDGVFKSRIFGGL
jgi:adenine-specific DNA-methyltransferase